MLDRLSLYTTNLISLQLLKLTIIQDVETSTLENMNRNRRGTGHHFTEEILAQAICQSYANEKNLLGVVYAVGRRCPPWPNDGDSCKAICESVYLHVQDSATAHSTWSCVNAMHIYHYRPATTTNGQRNTGSLGLKSTYASCTYSKCGPNYCCCYATPPWK